MNFRLALCSIASSLRYPIVLFLSLCRPIHWMAARYLKRDFDDESFAIVNAINPRLDLIRKEKGTTIMSGWAGLRGGGSSLSCCGGSAHRTLGCRSDGSGRKMLERERLDRKEVPTRLTCENVKIPPSMPAEHTQQREKNCYYYEKYLQAFGFSPPMFIIFSCALTARSLNRRYWKSGWRWRGRKGRKREGETEAAAAFYEYKLKNVFAVSSS